MTTPNSSIVFSILTILVYASPAKAGVEDKYLNSLKNSGYKCTDTPHADGYFCTSGQTRITIPKGMESHTHNVFYAHGLIGVCGNGASGEFYLKNESPTLKRIGAIAILPIRPSAGDASFPLTSYLAKVEKDLSSEAVPLIVSGHSAAGSFLGSELSSNPAVTRRVDQVLLIDAIYGTNSAYSWERALAINANMKVQLVSSTTASQSKWWVNTVKPHFPNAILPLIVKGEEHCQMPKYFDLLK